MSHSSPCLTLPRAARSTSVSAGKTRFSCSTAVRQNHLLLMIQQNIPHRNCQPHSLHLNPANMNPPQNPTTQRSPTSLRRASLRRPPCPPARGSASSTISVQTAPSRHGSTTSPSPVSRPKRASPTPTPASGSGAASSPRSRRSTLGGSRMVVIPIRFGMMILLSALPRLGARRRTTPVVGGVGGINACTYVGLVFVK